MKWLKFWKEDWCAFLHTGHFRSWSAMCCTLQVRKGLNSFVCSLFCVLLSVSSDPCLQSCISGSLTRYAMLPYENFCLFRFMVWLLKIWIPWLLELLSFFATWWILAPERSLSWNLKLLRFLSHTHYSFFYVLSKWDHLLSCGLVSDFRRASTYHGSVHRLVHIVWVWLLWQHPRYLETFFVLSLSTVGDIDQHCVISSVKCRTQVRN